MRFLKSSIAKRLGVLVLSVMFFTACPSLAQNFRVGLAAAKPFVQSLVPAFITQAQADLATTDVGDGIEAVIKTEQCLKAITVTGAAKRVAKAQCYYTTAQDLKVILARHNLDSPKLNQIATIVQAAISAFEAYYSQVNDETLSDDGGESADQELDRKMKDVKRQLDALN